MAVDCFGSGHVASNRAASRWTLAAALLLMALCPACTSRDDRAATAAGIAADALQGGDIASARFQIGRALAARDDVGDYWMLSGRIALAARDLPGAFTAFETALTLDHGNIEALTRLCQLAVSSGQPERAERYADQLAQLQPGNLSATDVQAALALQRADKAAAARLIGQVLAQDPTDAAALVTRSRLLSADGDFAGAAKAAEAALAAPGDPVGRLGVLKDAYLKAGDAAGWRRTIARLAQATPRSADARLDLARSLYDAGDAAGGLAATRAVLALKAGDVAATGTVLHLWQAQAGSAMPAAAIVTAAAGQAPETRAALATYANGIGRPDLALRALGDAGGANSDVTVARAQTQALLGRRDEAARMADAVLAADPDQPRALALRGVLRGQAGEREEAVADLRHALSADPADATARLALADLQAAGGDGVLAAATLQDGLGNPGADPRLVTRLAQLLRVQGRPDSATAAITAYVRANPFTRRPPG